jgi:mannose-6-phosphate isomerase-like protein (cupin superfamily)
MQIWLQDLIRMKNQQSAINNQQSFNWWLAMQKINLQQKLSFINDYWNPRIAGELNGQYVKLVKFQGPFTWHHHDNEDELFMVVHGRFRMEYRDENDSARQTWIEEGELIIVPRGVDHRPVADEECHVLLFEPVSTLNTGEKDNEFTRKNLDTI